MTQLVKPGSAVKDPRAQTEKDAALNETTAKNLQHIQKQLVASGHSIEAVICGAAKNLFGVTIQPHVPKPKAVKAPPPAEVPDPDTETEAEEAA
jgi:hypothetical protein